MPATTIGIHTKEEWKAYYAKLCKETDWSAGSFASAFCSCKSGPMIDYILDVGVKIFRDDNRNGIKSGMISRKDIMHIGREKDKFLIGYLVVNALEPCRSSMMKYAAEKYGMDELRQPHQNIDGSNDPYYEECLRNL